MSTLATNVIGKSYNLPVSWDGRRYSDQDAVPAFTAPSSLAASESSGTITLTWTNGTATAETIVERSLTGGGGWSTIATKAATVTTHDDAPGGSGTFYYRVSHLQNEQQTSYSSTVSETISYVPPVADGDEKTVTITGAGSNVPASQFQFLGGSNGPIELAADGVLFDTFMPAGWYMSGEHGTYVSTEYTFNGGKSLEHDPAVNGWQKSFSYDTGGIQRTGFARYDVYFDNPSNLTTGQLKQLRFVGGTSHSSTMHDNQYANVYITRNSSQYVVRNDSPSLSIMYGGAPWHQPNEWVSVEARVTDCSDVNVADGSIRISVRNGSTGELLGTFANSGLVFRTSAAALVRQFCFQFYLGNGFGAGTGCRAFIDRDVACAWSTTTTPPKFILLGNASTYDACTVTTYCEWITWTDNGATSDITFRVNQGRHTSPSGLYVYAMSDAGVPINSTGVALT